MSTAPEVLVVGAGIAGVSTSFHLARAGAVVTIADRRAPLSLTSDKSTEAYRNWWPSSEMIAFMNRSIDLLEGYAAETGDVFNLGRRGYLFVTADPGGLDRLIAEAEAASSLGAGPLRSHSNGDLRKYRAATSDGWTDQPVGADVFVDGSSLRSAFPYLDPSAIGAVHVRRAGWFSAHQLGTWMLADARARGCQFHPASVESISEGPHGLRATFSDGRNAAFDVVVNCGGPLVNEVAGLVGEVLPVHSELHLKVAFRDHLEAVPRDAPMLIWNDPQRLAWSEDEREALTELGRNELIEAMPGFCHGRPEGRSGSTWVLGLWEYQRKVMEPAWPLPRDEMYAEAVIRGLSTMVPSLAGYRDRLPHTVIDGGFYTKTADNRLLVGPMATSGMYVLGALSGYGIMAACAAGELVTDHILDRPLPDHAGAFHPARFRDPGYSPTTDPSAGQL